MSYKHWKDIARLNGWGMPYVSKWKRLPIIRHIRALFYSANLSIFENYWRETHGYEEGGYDDWVIYGMWRGWERIEVS